MLDIYKANLLEIKDEKTEIIRYILDYLLNSGILSSNEKTQLLLAEAIKNPLQMKTDQIKNLLNKQDALIPQAEKLTNFKSFEQTELGTSQKTDTPLIPSQEAERQTFDKTDAGTGRLEARKSILTPEKQSRDKQNVILNIEMDSNRNTQRFS